MKRNRMFNVFSVVKILSYSVLLLLSGFMVCNESQANCTSEANNKILENSYLNKVSD